MKKTSKEFMEWLGLQVGDRIKIEKSDCIYIIDDEYKIIHENGLASNYSYMSIRGLIDLEVEILPRPKRVGDLKCSDYVEDCSKCPVRVLCGDYSNEQDTFYEMLQGFVDLSGDFFDQEIHDLLKARLDKEVE